MTLRNDKRISISRTAWILRERYWKLISYKWQKIIPKHWRETAFYLLIVYTMSIYCILFIELVPKWSVFSLVPLLMALASFLASSFLLFSRLLSPIQTAAESPELRLAARRFRRAAYTLEVNGPTLVGFTDEQVSAFRVFRKLLGGKIAAPSFRSLATRIDLLILSSQIITLSISEVILFGVIYWRVDQASDFCKAVLYSLGLLSTVELVSIHRDGAILFWSACQIGLQFLMVVLIIPLLLNLYDEDRRLNIEFARIARRFSSEIMQPIREHEKRYGK